ncbi:hypothetical protein [Anaerotruncus massiliensis (ex Togo et al. 2019)]|uniref:hypothetical protein n=1 Tax=Anaerotruncus massiliensis (ex Togo et al. 2019) TaxID=1673720 RepID=UPI0020872B05|nr:hypothetical protein [Anaerotruncus massiliensis (ex Togo et al. 2019)]GKH47087.1 hypothetical protein CE91St45_16490 [Oscillospiraceae bacterium]
MARPTKMTPEVIAKLEEAFGKGMSDREACCYADIAPSTLFRYCQRHERFSERKELLKENLKMRAKLNLAEKIEGGDVDMSLWYLERKCRDEFSRRTEADVAVVGKKLEDVI